MSLVVPINQIFDFQDEVIRNNPDWKVVNLSEVATVLNGFAFPSSSFSQSNGVPLIRIRNIATSSTDLYYAGEYDDKYIINKDDLLIGMDGNFECHRWNGLRGLLNQRVCKIIPDTNLIEEDFFLHQLNDSLSRIQKATSSVTVGHLSSRDIANIPVLLPPYEVQKKLNSILKEATKLIQNEKNVIGSLKRNLSTFRQSILSAAVTGKLTEVWREQNQIGFGWIDTVLKDVCATITDGDHQPPPKTKDGIPFLVINNINTGKLNFENTRYVSESYYNDIPDYKVPKKGDLLFSVVGSIGITILVNTDDRFCFQRHIALLRANDLIEPEYLYYLLLSDHVHKQAIAVSTGSAQMTVPLGGLRKIQVMLPPKKEQIEIINRLRCYFSLGDDIEKLVDGASQKTDKLTHSILAKAFRGEL